jgi:hypothetical protein
MTAGEEIEEVGKKVELGASHVQATFRSSQRKLQLLTNPTLMERYLLVQLHCSCVGHVILSGDNVTKRAQAPVASPD